MNIRTLGTCSLAATAIVIGGYLVHGNTATPEPAVAATQPARTTTSAAAPAAVAPSPAPVRVVVVESSAVQSQQAQSQQAQSQQPRSQQAQPQQAQSQQLRTGAVRQAQSPRSSAQGAQPIQIRVVRTTKVVHRSAKNAAQAGYQIVATDGSIVYIGDHGRLTANTGATGSSGVVALDTDKSSLTSGTSQQRPTSASDPMVNESLDHLTGGDDHATALSGFEDHSVSVSGDNQLVTYDDSNVFVNRNGRINANTGDTDSSGLNAVDVTGSRVRSGNSGDGEGDDTGDDEAEAPSPAEDRAAASDDEGVEPVAAEQGARSDDESEAPSGSRTTPVRPDATVTDEGESSAEGQDAVVVGADGVDDVAIRSQGNGDVISYDDSNVVIGGTGQVNAQIGDSDTGGAVVMGVHGSDVAAGCEGDLC